MSPEKKRGLIAAFVAVAATIGTVMYGNKMESDAVNERFQNGGNVIVLPPAESPKKPVL